MANVHNNSNNCTNLGRLYTWENVKTACPTGWHVPTREEYEVMSKNALKIELVSQDDSWQDKLFTSNATFIPGLELKGTGIRLLNGNFEYDHRVGAFWLADTANVDSSYYVLRNMYSSSKDISSWASYQDNSYGLSIRCIKDK